MIRKNRNTKMNDEEHAYIKDVIAPYYMVSGVSAAIRAMVIAHKALAAANFRRINLKK